MAAAAQVFSNRYEILREIARGGMSEVYLAHDRHLDRPVALKVLSSELSRDPSFVERFRREAQAAANLSHPNIVAVYDWGQEEGTYFIVMEYVDGQALRDLLSSERRIEPFRAADIAAEVAAGLSFAHRCGVVHRDVKPGNVLLPTSGQVKVTDFGIARADATEGLTQTGSVMGTATYFSPEQARGLPVDGRSDVYSLGVLLYEMVCGAPPFTGENPVSVAYQHVREPIPSPRERVPDLPLPLERVITTALAKDPARRYQSADDLRADLLRFRRGRPIVGVPLTAQVAEIGDATATRVAATPVGVAASPVTAHRRRNPWGIAVVVALLVALIGGIAFLLTRQLDSAETSGGTADVPNVVRDPPLTVEQATLILKQAGFAVEVDQIARDNVAAGIVLNQTPAAGTKLHKREPVRLGVSSGPGDVPVPDVTNRDEATATTLLQDQGFKVTSTEEASDTVDAGKVIRTEPAARAGAPKGSTVGLIVSSGAAKVTVPNVVGRDQVTAAAQLGQAGFEVHTTREASNSVDAGNVIRTEPEANTEAVKGTAVTIVVSSGRDQVAVPDVVDKDQASAEGAIRAAGLSPSATKVRTTPGQNGIVIGQSPGGGTKVDPGSTVSMQVGDGSLGAP